NTAKSSPHLEIFRKKDVEVILFYDRIDEWLIGHLNEYEGKSLQSVAKGDVSLDEISDADNQTPKEELQQKDEKLKSEFDDVLKRIKAALGDQIKEARLSHRLTNSPVCLVVDENDMGSQ